MSLTVRLRLTLMYGMVFLLSGAVLLGITFLLVSRSQGFVAKRESRSTGESVTFLWGDVPDVEALSGLDTHTAGQVRSTLAEQRATMLDELVVNSAMALAIMAVISILIGWLVAGRVLRPLQTMTGAIQRISARNVHERLAVAGPRDELKDLADTVDGLLGRLETALDSHRRFVANAAHELRTPLTVEHALLEEAVIDPDATVDSMRAQFKELMAASEQQARLLESLLVLATSERGLEHPETVDLPTVIRDVLRAAGAGAAVTELRPALITGDPALVERLVANLVDNAVEYDVTGGGIEIICGTADGRCFLSVANTGPVVPPGMVDRLLNPFQRLGRTAGDGHHGLGLSIVASIAAAHSADLTVRARTSGGLSVRVVFPEVAVPVV